MRIQFKQEEIVAALKQYIVQQGISLYGKAVHISFTAKRIAGGLEADIEISDDNFIPGIDDAMVETVEERPVLMVVTTPQQPIPIPPPVEPEVVQEAPEPVAAQAPSPSKSLFG